MLVFACLPIFICLLLLWYFYRWLIGRHEASHENRGQTQNVHYGIVDPIINIVPAARTLGLSVVTPTIHRHMCDQNHLHNTTPNVEAPTYTSDKTDLYTSIHCEHPPPPYNPVKLTDNINRETLSNP